jgi:hypothetical protein
LKVDREARLKPELRATKKTGGARAEAIEKAGTKIIRSKLDTNKAQVTLLCEQALERASEASTPPSLSHLTIELYTREAIRAEGWSVKQKKEWAAKQAHREAAYQQRYQNLVSTAWHTATGRQRGPIPTVFVLAQSNPSLPDPGVKIAKNRMSSMSRKQAMARKKNNKRVRQGDASSNTGIPARGNRM